MQQEYLTNPLTGRKVKKNGKIGKLIQKNLKSPLVRPTKQLPRPPLRSPSKNCIGGFVKCFMENDGSYSVIMYCPQLLSYDPETYVLYQELLQLSDDQWISGKFLGHEIPRKIRWHSMNNKSYKFSGKTYVSTDYTEKLEKFQKNLISTMKRQHGSSVKNVNFDWDTINSVLVNKYRDNTDSVSWHSDDEHEFGTHPTIVSVSLGVSRTFKMKRMNETERRKNWLKSKKQFIPNSQKENPISLVLNHGDVLVMAGSTQDYWLHSVPKEPKKISSTRFNLTFRPYK